MVWVYQLLERDLDEVDPRAVSSGFTAVDRLTGGLQPGWLTVVSTAPGQGKTTLATQLAGAAAVAGRRVQLHCPRESPRACAARLVAALGGVSYLDLLTGLALEVGALRRARRARSRLSASDLDVVAGQADPLEIWGDCEVLVVDDVHRYPEGTLDRLRAASDAGKVVVATLPEDLLCEERIGTQARLRRPWADPCDLALGVAWAEPDEADRQGQADLSVLKNRHGPLLHDTVVFEGVCARFRDLDPG